MSDTEDMSDDNTSYTYTYDKSYDDNIYNPINYNFNFSSFKLKFTNPSI